MTLQDVTHHCTHRRPRLRKWVCPTCSKVWERTGLGGWRATANPSTGSVLYAVVVQEDGTVKAFGSLKGVEPRDP
jgi:hypothetical protein